MAKRNGYLTNRDRRILKFVHRYRLGTAELLAAACLPDGPDERAAATNMKRILRRLERQGLIRKLTFAPGCSYVVLTRPGCAAIKVRVQPARPFTEQSLPAALGIAWYCVHHCLERLTVEEVQTRYPELCHPGLRSSCYYLADTTEGMQLGMILVDRGGTPRRLHRKLRRVIFQRKKLSAFEALIGARRFRVTVLTGLPSQQQNLRRQIKRKVFQNVHLDIALVPELGEMLTLG